MISCSLITSHVSGQGNRIGPVCVWVCGTYIVRHFDSTELHCASSTCDVHHRHVLSTLVPKRDPMSALRAVYSWPMAVRRFPVRFVNMAVHAGRWDAGTHTFLRLFLKSPFWFPLCHSRQQFMFHLHVHEAWPYCFLSHKSWVVIRKKDLFYNGHDNAAKLHLSACNFSTSDSP